MYMILSKQQYNQLPSEYKKYFTIKGGDKGEHVRNVHP